MNHHWKYSLLSFNYIFVEKLIVAKSSNSNILIIFWTVPHWVFCISTSAALFINIHIWDSLIIITSAWSSILYSLTTASWKKSMYMDFRTKFQETYGKLHCKVSMVIILFLSNFSKFTSFLIPKHLNWHCCRKRLNEVNLSMFFERKKFV